jgi:hypothetical protein
LCDPIILRPFSQMRECKFNVESRFINLSIWLIINNDDLICCFFSCAPIGKILSSLLFENLCSNFMIVVPPCWAITTEVQVKCRRRVVPNFQLTMNSH